MPIGIRNLEFLNHNAQRAYPLAADATRRDTTSVFRLPDELILELRLPVHWGMSVEPAKFYLRRLAVSSAGLRLDIGYSGAEEVDVASAFISRLTHEAPHVYPLTGVGDFADSRGSVTIGDFDNLDKQPTGDFTFDLAGGRLEADAITPSLRGISSLRGQNGSELTPKVFGAVRLRAGRNFRITPILVEGEDTVLELSAIEGEGLNEECVCDDTAGSPVLSLSQTRPDGSGNINIIGNDCLQVSSGGDGQLIVKDVCSEPCCGAEELEVITDALQALGDRANTLAQYLTNLNARVIASDNVVLGAKLGDRGCSPASDCS